MKLNSKKGIKFKKTKTRGRDTLDGRGVSKG
jgi:hypothetical protein